VARSGAANGGDAGVAVGTVLLGKYRIDAILGKGGMGIVAQATHLQLDEKVAIKFLHPDVATDSDSCRRFLREAQAAVKLKNEHVARVTDVGTLETGSPYMVMEFLEGIDLAKMLETTGQMAPALAVELLLQACAGLAEAHALGIVHRDLKPSNFFVTWRADGAAQLKVLDFGISKAPVAGDVSLTRTQTLLGTPAYMSPEQMRSARLVDPRSDIWSLGTVLYELLQGRRPFEAETFSAMCVKVAVDPPTPFTVLLPPGLGEAVLRCLDKDASHRFQTVAELAAALAPFARDPRQASVVVERVRRTLGRRGATRSGTRADSSIGADHTPPPRTPKQMAVAVPEATPAVETLDTPAPPPARPPSGPRPLVGSQDTERIEATVPETLSPSIVVERRGDAEVLLPPTMQRGPTRRPLWIALAVVAMFAVGAAVAATRISGDDATTPAAAAPAPAPAAPAPTPTAPAVASQAPAPSPERPPTPPPTLPVPDPVVAPPADVPPAAAEPPPTAAPARPAAVSKPTAASKPAAVVRPPGKRPVKSGTRREPAPAAPTAPPVKAKDDDIFGVRK